MATLVDPLAEMVTLLQPGLPFSKIVNGAGQWSVRRVGFEHPVYYVVLEGSSHLAVDGHPPILLQAGDFVLISAAPGFTISSVFPAATSATSKSFNPPYARLPNGEFHLGDQQSQVDVRLLIGHCVFGSPDAALLVSLLPQLVLVRGNRRLTTLVQLVVEECREVLPARDLMLERLMDALFIEALRSNTGTTVSRGLLRGMTDARLAQAIRAMHANPAEPWTVAQLAAAAALSRSTFFERFKNAVGVAPMEYLLAWRMALAKDLLRRGESALADVAERVGYSSASTFSGAFARYTGVPPTRYAREQSALTDYSSTDVDAL